MSKEQTLVIQGNVIECLPNALFKVKLENEHLVVATISGKMRKHNIKILLHDRVDVEISVYDLSKGRIVFRHK